MASPIGAGGVRGSGPPIDILCNAQTNRKARPLLEALQRGGVEAGFDARIVDHHEVRPKSWLMLYGPGGMDRIQYLRRGRVVAFDLAYWDRKGPERKYRVSINGLHCPERIMRWVVSPFRWKVSGHSVGNDRPADGPILLVGNGPKSAAIGAKGWELATLQKLRDMFPGRPIWFRPKPGRSAESVPCDEVRVDDPIDDLLLKVGLVVCRHSNVTVDACRLGVQAVCEDGAAACIYPPLERWQEQPTKAQREDFLQHLAWWQWSPAECATSVFWDWLKREMRAD